MDKIIYDLLFAAGKAYGKEKSCVDKVDFKTEELANKKIKELKKQNKLQAYPCYFCGGWHIGRKISISELRAKVGFLYPEEIL